MNLLNSNNHNNVEIKQEKLAIDIVDNSRCSLDNSRCSIDSHSYVKQMTAANQPNNQQQHTYNAYNFDEYKKKKKKLYDDEEQVGINMKLFC